MKHSFLASRSATKDVLDQWGLFTKKALGQHFLIEDGVIGRILALAAVESDQLLLEVGPGIGTLTVALLRESGGVISIERDTDLLPVLAQTTSQDSEKSVLIEGDALKVTEQQILSASQTLGFERPPHTLVSNLPYAVAATIILDYFQRFSFLESATIMVQSEVAARIAACPDSKAYGSYTVKLRLHAATVGRFQVAPSNFLPPPRVESAVIRLDRHECPFDSDLVKAASFIADAAFAQRRKTIRNSMGAYFQANGLEKQKVDDVLQACSVPPTVRGETLDVEKYLQMGRYLLTL